MKLIGISLTPSMNLTDERAVIALATEKRVVVGPLNTSNARTRFQVMADGEEGYDFLDSLVAFKGYRVELIPAMDVHR